jgi:predicted RND superfamily exporter protein
MTLPRRVIIGLWIVLPVLIAIGVARLHFDVEVLDLLPLNNRAVEGLKLYQQHFSNARELIITVRSGNAEETENAARAIAELLRGQTNLVAGATWQPPWLENPGQTAELIGYLWLNQPPEEFNQLTNRLAPEHLPSALAEVRDELAGSMSPAVIGRLSYDPLRLTQLPESAAKAAPDFAQGQDLFSSRDGKFRIIFVEANTTLATYKECYAWLRVIQSDVESARAENHFLPDVIVEYTGRPAFVSEIARGMEHDITISVGGTSVIIALLFWLAHRRVKPMLWLLTLLALILAGTLALGGLIYGNINVVSMGFAAILLGLAVDYAVVHYQEALAHPELSVPEIRSAIAPSIFWAATTTICAFLVLNFGGLPGLGQLGTLVGVGVALSAFIMIFAFLPPLFPGRRKARPKTAALTPALSHPMGEGEGDSARGTCTGEGLRPVGGARGATRPTIALKNAGVVFAISAIVILFSVIVLISGTPKMDPTANALRPRNSKAYAALDQIQQQLGQKQEPLWLLVAGKDESEVARKLDAAKPILDEAVTNHVLTGFTLASAIWPRPEFQAANRPAALKLAEQRDAIRTAILTNGFTETAFGLAGGILDTWRRVANTRGVFWPTNELDRWIFEKLVARTSTNFYALGFLYPSGTNSEAGISGLEQKLETENDVWLSGWQLLGRAVLGSVMKNLWKLVVPMVGLVFLSLWLAFRRATEILLSLAILVLSGLLLMSVMRLTGWSWNLLNLMGLPLILGTGVDYSIFMQLALRRYHGDLQMSHRAVGRALLLCGATAAAGFGALTFSSNAGMASLGQVCAVGIASNMLISVFLLPTWWAALTMKKQKTQS